jgi:hypothetical protein
MRILLGVPLLAFTLFAAEEKPVPKVPVGKDTTVITGPLTKEGYIDYETAVNERLGKGITPEQNANVLIWKAFGPKPEGARVSPEVYKWLGIDEPPDKGDYLQNLGTYLEAHAAGTPIGELAEDLTHISQRPWAAKDHPHLAGWLSANEKPLAVLIEATKRPHYFNPLVSSHAEKKPGGLLGALLPSVQKCRSAASALQARAMLRVKEGKFDEAWQDLLACHRLGRLVARGATLIEMLVGIAVDAIASRGDVVFLEAAGKDSKQVMAWLKDLQSLPPMPPLADKLDLAERFSFLDGVQIVRRGGIQSLEGLIGRAEKQAGPPDGLPGVDFGPALRNGNLLYDRMVAAARTKDRPTRETEWRKIEMDIRKIRADALAPGGLARELFSRTPPETMVGKKIGEVLVGIMVPATVKVQQANDRCEQIQRNLHVAFALVAYHREHGRYPEKLSALVPAFLPEVPGDLFSNQALIYRPKEQSFLLYSVGVNGRDDGGRWYDDDPPGDDPSVRLPLPPLKARQ